MGKVQTEIDMPQVINYQATTVNVGTTTTLNSNQNATVSNAGTETNAILNFGIPKGKSAYEQAVEGGYTGTEQEFRTYMANSANYAAAAHTWAEGTDEEVEVLGGEHSAEGWAAVAAQATSGKQDVSNLVTSISADSTDAQYPSAKLVYDQLYNKADKDLSNLSLTGENHFSDKNLWNVTSAGKGAVTGWVMPDYSSSASFTLNSSTTYTAQKNGFVFIYTSRAQDLMSNVKINGVQVGYSQAYWGNIQYFFPVSAGDVISTDYDSIQNALFCPLKEAQ